MYLVSHTLFRSYVKCLVKELVYGGHLLSLGATGIVAAGIILSGKDTDVFPILFLSYLISQIVYNSDHLKDIKDTTIINERKQHLEKTYNYQVIGLIIYTIFFIIISFYTTFYATLISIIIILGGVLYTYKTKKWTRSVVGFKNYYIAFFWSLLVLLIPFHYSESAFTRLTATVFLYVFIRWIINSVVFDIKDVKTDKQEGLKTFPVEIGVEKTIKLLHIMNILSSLLIILGVVIQVLPIISLVLNVFTIYSAVYLYKISNMSEKQIRLISYTIVDGEYLFWPIALIMMNNLF